MTNDEVKDDLIELEHCNLVCLVSDDDDDDDIYIMVKCLFVCHEKSSLPHGSVL